MSLDPTESFSSAGALGGIGPISNINLSQQFGSVAGAVALPEHQKPGINGPENYQVAQNYPDGSHSGIGYHPATGKVYPQAAGGGSGLFVDVKPDRNGIISSHGILKIGPPGTLGR